MARAESKKDQFAIRRRKEQVAFLVVKFLRAYVLFQAIDKEFESFARAQCLDGCAIFERVRGLVLGHLFDLKERAHALFRSEKGSRRTSARSSSETRSLDSLIGTGYHLALILQESLYQVERYTPELEKEKDELSARVAAESAELAITVEERCRAVFKGIAEVVHRFLARAHENEILVLNLVQNVDLLEQVYGEGSAEKIFSALCSGHDLAGATAFERAQSFARERCGNITGIPPAPSAAAGSPAAGSPAAGSPAASPGPGRRLTSRATAS